MEYYNYRCGQIALAIVLLVGIIVIVKPSFFVYISGLLKYRFYSRRKLIKRYEKTTLPLIKKYNEVVDLIAASRREADNRLHEWYNYMLSRGLPESLARKTVDDLNHQTIETYDKFIQENLIPVRDVIVNDHNSVTASIKETVEKLDKFFGIKNGYMPFKML